MQEIKFRVWWQKQMRHNAICGNGQVLFIPNGTGEYLWINQAECDVMQFTGLKDESDKDIYRGDIIEYTYYHPVTGKQVYRNEIVFNEGKGCWCAEYMDGEYHYFGEMIFKMSCHVIGNIYKKPYGQ